MDILCVGQLVCDILVKPVDYEHMDADTKRVEEITLHNGGDCMNVAVNLGKLGNSVGFAGKVGDDSFGDFLKGRLKDQGIDIRGLRVAPGQATSSVIVLISGEGQRVFLYYGGTNDSFSLGDIDLSLVEECRVVHVGGAYLLPGLDGEGTKELFKMAKLKGKLTSADVTWDTTGRWLEVIRPCLPYLDFFMPSYGEAIHITGEKDPVRMGEFLQRQGVGTVVIKLGKDGAYVKARGEEGFIVPAFTAAVVDTTGAGDAFVAGYLTALLRQQSLYECARFACAVASFCIGKVGATTGVPCYQDVAEFLLTKT